MTYEKQRILTADRNPNGGKDYEAEYEYLVTGWVHQWKSEESSLGHQENTLAPAYTADPKFSESKGRCWVVVHTWMPSRGYTASGYGRALIPFTSGCEILIDAGKFNFPLPTGVGQEGSAS